MFRKVTALLLALLLPCAALAEVYEGTAAALGSVTVRAEAAGTAASVEAVPGQRVEAGEALMALKGEKAFAAQDGTVALIDADAGDEVDGEVLAVSPLERYTVYCTVDSAYKSATTQLVHAGEALYIRCTADGTHLALGVITEIDGSEYRVLTLGGELYLGETVYLYRDADFTAAQRVGIGTVIATDAQSYTAEGVLTRLLVDEGDTVERGQLLYEIGGGSVEAPISGIVSSVSVRAGEKVQADQAVAEIVPEDQICVEIELDEADAARIVPGQAAMLLPTSGGDEDDGIPGMVLDVSWVPSDGTYTARILPEDASALALGMSVTVRI